MGSERAWKQRYNVPPPINVSCFSVSRLARMGLYAILDKKWVLSDLFPPLYIIFLFLCLTWAPKMCKQLVLATSQKPWTMRSLERMKRRLHEAF